MDEPTFAEGLKTLLAERHLSYRALGLRVYASRSTIGALAAGSRAPSEDLARRIDEALNAGGELAALAAKREDDAVDRRSFLAVTAVGAGAAILPSLLMASSRVASSDDWAAIATEYGHAYRTIPMAGFHSEVAEDLNVLLAVIGRTTNDRRRASLSEAAGRLAGLLARASTDLGRRRESRHAWLVARKYAEASGSPDLQLWVYGQEATAGFYADRAPLIILGLADAGLRIDGGARAAGRAYILSAKAQAQALLGDLPGALRSLDEISTVDPPSDGPYGYAWGDDRVLHTASFVYSYAGPFEEAVRAQDSIIRAYSADQVLNRLQIEMHRAASLVRDGNLAHGVNHATTTLDSAPSSRYLYAVAERVLNYVPAPRRQEAAVRQYADALTTAKAALA